jgi:hypothetical protein
MRTIIEHLEDVLGPIAAGWSSDADGRKLPVQIALFTRGPIAGTHALATIGLSNHTLSLGDHGKTVRQELVMLFREQDGPRNLPGVMLQVAMSAFEAHRGYLRGEVIGPRGALFANSSYEALYVAIPVYFPYSFHIFQPEAGAPVVFAWLVPITHGEAHFVQRRGWKLFEEQLEAHDPDLVAADRPGIDAAFSD